MNEEDKLLLAEYHRRKSSFENITFRAHEVMRLNGKLTTMFEFLNEELLFKDSSCKIFEDLTKPDEITFELPNNGFFSSSYDNEEENYSITYEEQPGIILNGEKVAGSFYRLELRNPLKILGINGDKLITEFNERKIEIETNINAKKNNLKPEQIEHIKKSREYPEESFMYTSIRINPSYLRKLKVGNKNYKLAIEQYIKDKFNKNQRKKYQNFYPFDKNYELSTIDLGNKKIPLKQFLNDYLDESRIENQYHNMASFETTGSDQEHASLEDNISTVIDPVTDKVVGFVYYTDIKNPFPNKLESINFANNPEEETNLAQAKIYLNNKTKSSPVENRYYWYGIFAKEYSAGIKTYRKRTKKK